MRLAALVLVVGCTASADPVGGPANPPRCKGAAPDCTAFGYEAGAARCTPEGDVELTACASARPASGTSPPSATAPCGNGKIDFVKEHVCAPCDSASTSCPCGDVDRQIEECDGAELDGQTCAKLGFLGGPLACGKDCRFDLSKCTAIAPGLPSLRAGGLAGLGPGNSISGALGARTPRAPWWSRSARAAASASPARSSRS